MIWGVLIGTYSSLFVAVPSLLLLKLGREAFSSDDDNDTPADTETDTSPSTETSDD